MMNILPSDKDAEKIVLGSIIGNKYAFDEVRDILKEDVFYDPFHQDIFKAIKAISNRGDNVDSISVLAEMQKNKEVDAFKFSQISTSFADEVYKPAQHILELHIRRTFIHIAEKLKTDSFSYGNDIIDILSEAQEGLKEIFTDNKSQVFTLHEAIKGVVQQMEENASSSKSITGTPTGFSKFDDKGGGLQKSDLIVIAADTSQGKTSLSVTMTLNAAFSGSSIAFYSMEMKKEQIAARMMSIASGVPSNHILYTPLDSSQFNIIDKGIGKLHNLNVYFDDKSTSNIDNILSSIRTLKAKYNIDGAIIDYIQILNVNMKGQNKESQMGEVARRLKNLAKELDIWIIALSQLNRDNINPVPSLTRLRDSGQIAEAADIVILLYRPEEYNKYYPDPFQKANTVNTAMIDIAKGRNIGLLKFLVGFNKLTTQFYDINDHEIFNSTSQNNEPF